MRTRVKICGITRVEDGLAAARAGADAIGLNFWNGTPRVVDVARARVIARALPPFVSTVGLFVDAQAAEVRAVLDEVGLDLLQFHGNESPAFCAAFGRPWIKTVHVKEGADLLEYSALFDGAAGLLFDTWSPGAMPGGTGKAFDWSAFRQKFRGRLSVPLVLSGGLTASNVADAIREIRPWAVDVASGVEALGADGKPLKGIKDAARIAAFVAGVRNADE